MTNPTSFDEFWPQYLRAHSHPTTRALHIGGTAVGLGCAALFLATGRPRWAVAGLVTAYAAAWAGHALVERNVPKTFSHPFWSVRGDFRMLRLALKGKLSKEVAHVAAETSPAVEQRTLSHKV